MDALLVITLILLTFTSVIVFAIWSKLSTKARSEDDTAPKSTLAADKSSTGKPADY